MGKISPAVLRRSVLRLIHHRDGSTTGEADSMTVNPDGSSVSASAAEAPAVLTVAPVSGPAEVIGMRGVTEAVNGLAVAGAEPAGVMLSLLLPQETDEAVLRQIIADADSTCAAQGMEILGGHTEVTDAVCRPVLSVTGVGSLPGSDNGESRWQISDLHPGEDLILTKHIAMEAAWLLTKAQRAELRKRFTEDLLDHAEKFGEMMSVLPEVRVLRDHPEAGVTAVYDVSRGGIFGALWEFADPAGAGLDVDIREIPIRQETVEICEYFDVNPYEALSAGSLLIATENGEETVRILEEAGIPAALIGRTTEGPRRILHNGGEVRYLDRPQPDSLLRVDGML